jgi:diguanylate cyclase (GGDEF)-like protein
MLSAANVRGASRKMLGVFLVLLLMCVSSLAMDSADPAALLSQADSIKTSNHRQFTEILQSLEERVANLTPTEQEYVRYLRGWQEAYVGNYEASLRTLAAFVATAKDPTLVFRARVTMVNVLSIAHRYEEAFTKLSQLLEQLDRIKDLNVREQGLTVAALLYGEFGQHDLSLIYADKVMQENASGLAKCRGGQIKVKSLYESSRADRRPAMLEAEIQNAVSACVAVGELTYANVVRGYQARLHMERNQLPQALDLLNRYYQEVQQSQYPRLISQYDVLLANLHWRMNDQEKARAFALRAVNGAVKNEFTEPLVAAYHLLYTIDKTRGDERSALDFYEKYAAADKGYLDDISARQLAYERVRHELAANKLQIESLQLQRKLDAKAIENVRLYGALLLVVLGFIIFWAYKTKRSQLHFMNLSRRDGLTGIFNRPHFMESAASTLDHSRKLKQDVSLILCDLDHFKDINDRYGHAEGDAALKRMVAACLVHLRAADVFARVGGEEFCVLLPACGVDDARQRADQLRVAIGAISEKSRAAISASMGVSATTTSGYDLNQLLAHADLALYQAKRAGRNCVVVYDANSVVTPIRSGVFSASS